jgi:xanthine dehydrogenase accessory factor
VLAALDVPDDQRARVHSPAGLDIGGRTAAEIALSVLAQVVQERRAAERHAPASVARAPAEPVRAVDPVCGMTVAAVDASPHVTIDGVTTWFCCEGCRKAFEKNPARYATAS